MSHFKSVKAIDIFITRDTDNISIDHLIQQRLVVSIAYACLICIGIITALFSFTDIPNKTREIGWLTCSISFSALIAILLYLRTGSVERVQSAGHLVVASCCAVLLFGIYTTGGPNGSQVGSLLVLIPVMAFFLLGSAAGWGWTILALGVYGFLAGLSLKGHQFPTHLAENGNIIASIFVSYTIIITASFVYSYEQLYRKQLKARLREQKKYEYMAMHDPLTNLANRKLFNKTLEAALARANREKFSTALLMIDLDHFKPINDLHGHQVGDAILVHVAESLQSTIRSSDLAARLGGDEFAVILEHVTHSDIALVADKLLSSINTTLQFDINGSVDVSCSIGVAISSPTNQTEDQAGLLYAQSDKALYKAKLKRGTWCFVNDNDSRSTNPDISKTINHQSDVSAQKKIKQLSTKNHNANSTTD